MDPNQVSQALTDPQAFLGQVNWFNIAISIAAGIIVPWLCGRLLQRRLGLLANVIVGTMASCVVLWVMNGFEKMFSQSWILGGLASLLLILVVLLTLSMRRP